MSSQAASHDERLLSLKREIEGHLETDLIPFWNGQSLDTHCGGYLTNFDAHGESLGTPEKYLNTQMRLLWWFSALAQRRATLDHAAHGFAFVRRHLWDTEYGGWFWKVTDNGELLDAGKVTYAQSFAVYALSEYARASGDAEAQTLAERTFDLLQTHAADTLHGGYLENLERDWTPSASGYYGGDRKGLDTHMHLMEAFTNLCALTRKDHHRCALLDLIDLIVHHMIDKETGAGRNQFDLAFTPLPAITIHRTWNAERQGSAEGEAVAASAELTSFGHNVELAWLLRRALEVAGQDLTPYREVLRRLLQHAAQHGVDWQYGGVFREGYLAGEVTDMDKEFWQNAEVLVGFLEGYALFSEPRYLEAAETVWAFVRRHFIAQGVGEWRTLLSREGEVIDAHLGNSWKVAYHTGRSALECAARLTTLVSKVPV